MTDMADRTPSEANMSPTDSGTASANELGEFRSLKADVWRQFRRHKGAMLGMVILTVIIIGCFLGPMLLPFDTKTPVVSNAKGPDGHTFGEPTTSDAMHSHERSSVVEFRWQSASLR